MPDEFLHSLHAFQDFEKQRKKKVFYQKNGVKVRKIFEFLHPKVDEKLLISIINDVRHIRKRKDTLIEVKVLNNLPLENVKVFREMHQFDKKMDFIYFRHSFTRNGLAYLIEKSMDI